MLNRKSVAIKAVQIKLLEALANSTSIALENVHLYSILKESNAQLKDSIQARDEYFSIASHELRTLISSLKLQLQMTDRRLQKLPPISSDLKGPLDVSLAQVDRLTLLVEQLLDVSRIRLGKIYLEYANANCSELLRKVVDFHRPALERAGCEISTDIEDEVMGQWDCLMLEQIFGNLLSNIQQHAPKSHVNIILKSEETGLVSIVIKDSGPGISETVKERLFHRFSRGHAPRHLGGLGLGLFISKSLIEAHKGKISVETCLPTGTQLKVFLPRSP